MKILGINYLSESSICYMVDGKLKFAISEERLNRIKTGIKPCKSCKSIFENIQHKIK